jgi:hypothetical protein
MKKATIIMHDNGEMTITLEGNTRGPAFMEKRKPHLLISEMLFALGFETAELLPERRVRLGKLLRVYTIEISEEIPDDETETRP